MKDHRPESLILLRIAADLHLAGRHPARWPQAWQAVCDFFECPAVFGEGLPKNLAPESVLAQINERTAQARACVEQRRGPCACTSDESRFFACRELLPHIEIALDTAHQARSAADPRLSALNALPFAVFVCDSSRRLLHVNTTGQGELDQAIWLRLADDRLVGANAPIEARLSKALSDDASDNRHMALLRPGQADADLMFQRVEAGQGDRHWVLRLLHNASHSHEGLPRLAMSLDWTPRQAELAQWLVSGCTLTQAAQRMGIVRGSANDLLKRLFESTGTGRQADLIGYLSRRLASY